LCRDSRSKLHLNISQEWTQPKLARKEKVNLQEQWIEQANACKQGNIHFAQREAAYFV
jgi:hypothetical protein